MRELYLDDLIRLRGWLKEYNDIKESRGSYREVVIIC